MSSAVVPLLASAAVLLAVLDHGNGSTAAAIAASLVASFQCGSVRWRIELEGRSDDERPPK